MIEPKYRPQRMRHSKRGQKEGKEKKVTSNEKLNEPNY